MTLRWEDREDNRRGGGDADAVRRPWVVGAIQVVRCVSRYKDPSTRMGCRVETSILNIDKMYNTLHHGRTLRKCGCQDVSVLYTLSHGRCGVNNGARSGKNLAIAAS